MIDFRAATGAGVMEVPLTGQMLLDCPLLNKGTAFTAQERREFGLQGLLPPHVDTLEEQVARAYEQYRPKQTDLERLIFLRHLQDLNETVFYRLLEEHIETLMPVIYTPVVGTMCQYYSYIFREPRGLFVSYAERDDIDTILDNRPYGPVDVIVVTDGERILGLGDQGVGGMGIPVGKLSLYTLCGGIHPGRTLPIMLDVGTNNPERLNDPLYAGSRHERVRGPEYDAFIERFVQAVLRKLPHVLLQWEDFARDNAYRLLQRYRDRLRTFNDDIQGTAAITTATLLAAVQVTGSRLRDQRLVLFGAGSAACGICEQLCRAMVQEGLPEEEAPSRFWLLNRQGLVHDGLPNLQPAQRKFVRPREELARWHLSPPDAAGPPHPYPSPPGGERGRGEGAGLAQVVKNVRPTILIGVSGQPGTFTEETVREMARHVARPIILPLSNPTPQSEAVPVDLLAWTGGRAIVATGSPFPPVSYEGRTIPIAQCNNSYLFPGVGLGVLAVRARRVTDEMFMAAARALASASPGLIDPTASLLPSLRDIRKISRRIALAVAAESQRQGLAEEGGTENLERLVDAQWWEPRYQPMRRKAGAGA